MKKASILILVLLTSCNSNKNLVSYDHPINPRMKNYIDVMKIISNKDSLLKIEPLKYLEALSFVKLDKGNAKHKIINTLPLNYFVTDEWIKKSDVEKLMPLIYEKKLSYQPWPTISSQFPNENSTKGIEAMHLIKIFRDSTFRYPSICSTCEISSQKEQDERADELTKWWKEFNQN